MEQNETKELGKMTQKKAFGNNLVVPSSNNYIIKCKLQYID